VTPELWMLLGLLLFAGGLAAWALITGDPGGPPRPVRTPYRHSQANRGQRTQRINPPPGGWASYRDRPGGERRP
jgi:hypothetical protein